MVSRDILRSEETVTIAGDGLRKADIPSPAEVRRLPTADPPEDPALDPVRETLLGLGAPGVAWHQAGGRGEADTCTPRENRDTGIYGVKH